MKGTRLGAGRKPNSAHLHWLTGDAGKRGKGREAKTVARSARRGPLPPRDLSPAAKRYWRRWAPLAVEAGTLTPQTVPGLASACRVAAELDAMRARIEQDGLTIQTERGLISHPLLTAFRSHTKQLENYLGRFVLAPWGKAVTAPAQPESAQDEVLDRLARRA